MDGLAWPEGEDLKGLSFICSSAFTSIFFLNYVTVTVEVLVRLYPKNVLSKIFARMKT